MRFAILRSLSNVLDRAHALVLSWRDKLLLDPGFQRWASRFPLTRPIARRQASAAFDLCAGFVYSQVLFSCVRLGVIDLVRRAPLPAHALAADLPLPERQAHLLLQAAIALDVLSRRPGDRIGLGMLGASIAANPGIGAMIEHHTALYADLADPVALLEGRPASRNLAAFWPYAGKPTSDRLHPSAVADYSALMASSQSLLADDIIDAYPFETHTDILDVGGGEGVFLEALARRHREPRLHLFDLPAVAERARARFDAQGRGAAFSVAGGDFFSDPLPSGMDLVTLVRIAHDHDDDDLLRLLTNIRRALRPSGTLLIAEPMSGDGEARRVSDVYFAFYLLAMGSGRPRTPDELAALARQAGFGTFRRHRTARPLLVSVVSATV